MNLYCYRDNSDTVFFVNRQDWDHPEKVTSVSDFLSHDWFRKANTVFILGTASNAPLIKQLYAHRTGRNIKVGSPSVCSTQASRQDPATVLDKMQELQGASSVGGWHAVSQYDFTVYAMVDQIVQGSWRAVNDHARQLLPYHPAFKAVDFIPTANTDTCCQLLARIVDPRWFVDSSKPDKIRRVYNYLGVGGRSQNVWNFDKQVAIPYNTTLAVESWTGVSFDELRDSNPDAFLPVDIDTNQQQFLWRAVRKGGCTGKAYRTATRKFIMFLRSIWLNELACKGRRLFVPEYFFSSQKEINSFKSHDSCKGRQRTL